MKTLTSLSTLMVACGGALPAQETSAPEPVAAAAAETEQPVVEETPPIAEESASAEVAWDEAIEEHLRAIAASEDRWAENCRRIEAIGELIESGRADFEARVGFFEDWSRFGAQVGRNAQLCEQGRVNVPLASGGEAEDHPVGLLRTWTRVRERLHGGSTEPRHPEESSEPE